MSKERRSTRMLSCSPKEFDQLAAELIAQGTAFRLRVWGDSMYPTIQNGDLVLVEPVETQSLRLGDILFYRRPFGHLAHRLVELRDGGNALVTKGDALDYTDPPIRPKDLLGRVVAVKHSSRGLPDCSREKPI